MPTLDDSQRNWIESTLSSLSLRERIGQTLAPTFPPNPASPAPESMAEFAAETGLGGGYMFAGDFEDCRQMVREMQQAAKVPLLICGDFEGGCGTRLQPGTHWPSRVAIGAADDEKLSYAMGRSVAMEATAAGYNWVYSPVVDLIGLKDYQRQTESFGRDPKRVGELAVEYIRGMQENGLAACAKHFPGDGFDDRDQHLVTTVNPLSAEDWWKQSAVPFQAAIDAGVMTIMVAHFGLPSIDPDAGNPQNPTPAVVSKYLVTEVLRKQMKFNGVIITDALNMGGVTYHHPEMERYRLALEAGNDVLLFVRRVPETIDHLEQCVKNGSLDPGRIDDAARRVLTLKARLGLHKMPADDWPLPDRSEEYYQSAKADSERLAEKSVTLLRDNKDLLPLKIDPGTKVGVVLVTNQKEHGFSLEPFTRELESYGAEVTSFVNPQTDAIYDEVDSGKFDLIITGLYFPALFGWSTSRAHGPSSRCIMSGFPIANEKTKAIYISFSNPYHLYEMTFMDPYMVTYSGSPASQRAAARAIAGQAPITGKIPCELDDFWKIGDGIMRDAHSAQDGRVN